MFEKIKELGVGSFGVVYLVKCLQNSVIRLSPAEYTANANQSAVKSSNVKKTGGSFLGGTVPSVAKKQQQSNIRELLKD